MGGVTPAYSKKNHPKNFREGLLSMFTFLPWHGKFSKMLPRQNVLLAPFLNICNLV